MRATPASRERVGVDGQRVVAGAEAGEVDERRRRRPARRRSSASRLPRSVTSTADGMTVRRQVRRRGSAGGPADRGRVRSSGAGTICTVTVGRARSLQRAATGSSTPTVTVSCTGRARAGDRDRLGQRLGRRASTALSGPTTSTVGGSAVILPTTKPGAGLPSTAGTTGTCP